jgi:hypothetical protein
MNTNEKATLGGNREVAHEKPDPNANLDRNRSPRKSTREGRLLSELRAAALTVSPGRAAFVTTASTRAWFRIERLDGATARVTLVPEVVVIETLLEDAAFLDAEPLGCVA